MVERVSGFPAGTILGELADAADSMKELGKNIQKVTINDLLKAARDQLATLSEAQTEALQDAVKASGIVSKFSFTSTVSGVVSSLSTIGSGIYLIREGNDLGKQLVCAGALQFLNTAVSSEGFWVPVARVVSLGNRNVEYILAPALPLAINLLTSIWTGRVITQLSPDDQKFIKYLEQITSIFNVCVSLGNVIAKLNQGMADRALTEIDTQMTVLNTQVSQLLRQRDYAAGAAKSIESGLQEVVSNQINNTSNYTKI